MSAGGHLATMVALRDDPDGRDGRVSTAVNFNGEQDMTINMYVDQAERITQVMRAAGADTEYVRIDGREGNCHADCWRVPAARTAIHGFLERTLSHDSRCFFENGSPATSLRRDRGR